MKIPLTRYGLRELILLPVLLTAVGVVSWDFLPTAWPWIQIVLGMLLVGGMLFFRDPERPIPEDANILLAPADGKVTDIIELEEDQFIKGPTIRIGIFLSVFDVHINRSPCAGRVEYINEQPGKCINAMRYEAASEQNRANSVGLVCTDHPVDKVLVKQITGAIARRIVCVCRIGDDLMAGERFGMIKFGSRTELFLPKTNDAQLLVKKGDIVRAGKTILVQYAKPTSNK
jgi:phosphatidylserine decarboxylase